MHGGATREDREDGPASLGKRQPHAASPARRPVQCAHQAERLRQLLQPVLGPLPGAAQLAQGVLVGALAQPLRQRAQPHEVALLLPLLLHRGHVEALQGRGDACCGQRGLGEAEGNHPVPQTTQRRRWPGPGMQASASTAHRPPLPHPRRGGRGPHTGRTEAPRWALGLPASGFMDSLKRGGVRRSTRVPRTPGIQSPDVGGALCGAASAQPPQRCSGRLRGADRPGRCGNKDKNTCACWAQTQRCAAVGSMHAQERRAAAVPCG